MIKKITKKVNYTSLRHGHGADPRRGYEKLYPFIFREIHERQTDIACKRKIET
jgi:hypothetical protein